MARLAQTARPAAICPFLTSVCSWLGLLLGIRHKHQSLHELQRVNPVSRSFRYLTAGLNPKQNGSTVVLSLLRSTHA